MTSPLAHLTKAQCDQAISICQQIIVRSEILQQDLAELRADLERDIAETQARIDRMNGKESR